MPARRTTALALLGAGAVLAGCGSGGDAAKVATVRSAPARTTPAAPTAPDGLEALVRRCGLAAARSAAPGIVPAVFRPSRTRVVVAQRTPKGFSASLIYGRSVDSAYQSLLQALPAAGYTVVRKENEGRDAELFLDHNGTPAEVRLNVARACGNAAQASVSEGSGD